MLKLFPFILFFLIPHSSFCQAIDTNRYRMEVEISGEAGNFFTNDPYWLGADGAASVDLGNGKVLWLFSDSFIGSDSSRSRKKSTFARNSIAIQDGYELKTASLKFYWNRSKKKPRAFFHLPGKFWFWTGHGVRIKDKLLIFLIQEQEVKTGIGFEAVAWYAVLIANPDDDPLTWKMKYIKGPETFGTIAGSAAVLADEKYLYAYGAVEPVTHEVYVLRWNLDDAYAGNLRTPLWWINGTWTERKTKLPVPEPLFIGATEYSVHYNRSLEKYIQVQSFGFGEGSIGIRMADHITGPWTEPHTIFTPTYPGVKRPFMYSAKAHPELAGDGMYITYNVNSFDFAELLKNQFIYFPQFIKLKISKKE
ncbi:MAG TPA: DUF5005 domain-containing protein [Ferruginibacter sp.]|nr:DUF5005 domain-containing protein [Ferruginibacter sp.]